MRLSASLLTVSCIVILAREITPCELLPLQLAHGRQATKGFYVCFVIVVSAATADKEPLYEL